MVFTSLITFGPTTKKIWYPILSTLFSFLNSFQYEEYFDFDTLFTEFGEHPIFFLWIMYLAQSVIILLYLYRKYKMRKIHSQKKNLPVKQILYLFVIFIFDLISSLSSSYPYKTSSYNSIFQSVTLLITMILCKTIIKYNFHKHHYFGVGIYFIGVIISTIKDIVDYKKKEDINWIVYIIIRVFPYLFLGFQETFEKYLMEKEFLDPFLMVSIEGLFGFVTITFSFFILCRIDCPLLLEKTICSSGRKIEDFVFIIKFMKKNPKMIFLYLSYFIFLFGLNVFRTLTNFHYTPLHRMIAIIGSRFLSWVLMLFEPFNKKEKWAVNLLTHVFNLIGLCIILEIIIIKSFGLNKNTDYEITIREINEVKKEQLLFDEVVNSNINNSIKDEYIY